MRLISLLFAMAVLSGAALAQTPASAPVPAPFVQGAPETVYSDAQRERDKAVARRFVQSVLRPSYNLDGQFSRWKQPLCVHVVGISPVAAHVIEQRIRDVAAQIGAPLDRNDPCIPNITVFVTPEPQTTLAALVANNHWLFDSAHGELKLLYPVQAWYEGLYRDYNGHMHLDVPWEILYPDCVTGPPNCPPGVPANTTRLRTGIQPEMGTATVLVDAAAITGMTLGSLGDYLALMTLAQVPATGRCQPAPSIANLFVKGCDADFHTTGLSEIDTAMLMALYKTPDQPEKLQMQRLMGNLQRDLEAK